MIRSVIRLNASSSPTSLKRCLLSRYSVATQATTTASPKTSTMTTPTTTNDVRLPVRRSFQTRAFTGFGSKKQKTDEENDVSRDPKLAQLFKMHDNDPKVQEQLQTAYLEGYSFRLLQDKATLPKTPLRRMMEYCFAFFGGIWLVNFCYQVAEEYKKIKAEQENGGKGAGPGPGAKNEAGGEKTGEKTVKLAWGQKKEAKKEDSAGPVNKLSMQVDLDIKQTKPDEIKVRFKDVKGVDEAKEELEFIVDFLKDPDRFSRLGGTLPKGVLLVGNPGVGKTLMAKAVAGEAGVPFFYASGSEFDEVYVGMGARRMRQLFAAAKKAQPCVLFIDEIDSCGAKRISSQMHPFANHTVNQMLTEMDGFAKNSGVIVLGATNRRENLDDALLRPGRFDVEVNVPLPDAKGREDILRLYLARVKIAPELDVKVVAKGTPGFSGADLENLVNQAAVHAAKERRAGITSVDIEWAKDKLTMGPEKKGKSFDAETIRNTAYHEAGHTVVAYFTQGSDPIHKVTILPRGQTLGHTAFVPSSESNRTKAQLRARLDVAMGGRIGEHILDDEQKIKKGVTTGASSDFHTATSIATAMVKQFGMSPLVGMRVFDDSMEEVSNKTKNVIDKEINRLIDESYDRAVALLQTHSEGFKKLAEALIEKETLSDEQIAEILGPKKNDSISDSGQV